MFFIFSLSCRVDSKVESMGADVFKMEEQVSELEIKNNKYLRMFRKEVLKCINVCLTS